MLLFNLLFGIVSVWYNMRMEISDIMSMLTWKLYIIEWEFVHTILYEVFTIELESVTNSGNCLLVRLTVMKCANGNILIIWTCGKHCTD